MIQRIHVHQGRLRANNKPGAVPQPPLILRNSRGVRYGYQLLLKDKQGEVLARVVYRQPPEKPLSCGSRIFIETEMEVEVQEQ